MNRCCAGFDTHKQWLDKTYEIDEEGLCLEEIRDEDTVYY